MVVRTLAAGTHFRDIRIQPGYTVFLLRQGSCKGSNPCVPGPLLDYTSVTTKPPPAATFGFNYWPYLRNSSTTLSDRFWLDPTIRQSVERDLDEMASLGVGVLRLMLWPHVDPKTWKLNEPGGSGDPPIVQTDVVREQAKNLVGYDIAPNTHIPGLLEMAQARGMKVMLVFGNVYLNPVKGTNNTHFTWQTGYAPDTCTNDCATGWGTFLQHAVRWINTYVSDIEASAIGRNTVIAYEYQNELSSRNKWAYQRGHYLRYLYDNTVIPRGKRAISVLYVDLDVAPQSAPLLAELQRRHLDYVSFHTYPNSPGHLNPDVGVAYAQVAAKFKDSTIFLGEFGCATPPRDSVHDCATESDQSMVLTNPDPPLTDADPPLGLIQQAQRKTIPYYVHWMLRDRSPPGSQATGLAYSPNQCPPSEERCPSPPSPSGPKDSLGSVLGLTTFLGFPANRLRNPDMEELSISGRPPHWTPEVAKVSVRTSASATNKQHARLELDPVVAGQDIRLRSDKVRVAAGHRRLYANAFLRSNPNVDNVALVIGQYDARGVLIRRDAGPSFAPSAHGWTWNNWLQRAGSWSICLSPATANVVVTVRGTARALQSSAPATLDIDTVSASTRPAPSC
jgi:hypothetical protein